jgi:hypothetical protein
VNFENFFKPIPGYFKTKTNGIMGLVTFLFFLYFFKTIKLKTLNHTPFIYTLHQPLKVAL